MILRMSMVTLAWSSILLAPRICSLFSVFLLLTLGALITIIGLTGSSLTVPPIRLAAAFPILDIIVSRRLAMVPIKSDPFVPCKLKKVTRICLLEGAEDKSTALFVPRRPPLKLETLVTGTPNTSNTSVGNSPYSGAGYSS